MRFIARTRVPSYVIACLVACVGCAGSGDSDAPVADNPTHTNGAGGSTGTTVSSAGGGVGNGGSSAGNGGGSEGGSDPGDPFEPGTYAYTGGDSFSVVNVTLPANPTVAASHLAGVDRFVSDVAVQGDLAFLAVSPNELRIVDMATTNLGVVGSYSLGANALLFELEIVGNYAYAGGSSKLEIVDVSTPSAPTHVGEYTFVGNTRGMVVRDKLVYLAIDAVGLVILDVSNPSGPVEVSVTATPGVVAWGPWGLSLLDDYAYLTEPDFGVAIYDVSIPAAPVMAAHFTDPDVLHVHEIFAVPGGYAYMARQDGNKSLLVADVSNPAEPSVVTMVPSQWVPHSIAIHGQHVYLGGGNVLLPYGGSGSVEVFDATDPAAPASVGFISSLDGNVYQGLEVGTVR